MTHLKAIETNWRGWRFRSRTEARWAVALTHAAIPFDYEAQGFDLPSGWYLPDFWLPERKAWLEIKGQEPNERELRLAAELAAGGNWVLIAVGPPDPERDQLTVVDSDGNEMETLFQLPAKAYAAARAERFDGRPATTRTATKSARTSRWG